MSLRLGGDIESFKRAGRRRVSGHFPFAMVEKDATLAHGPASAPKPPAAFALEEIGNGAEF